MNAPAQQERAPAPPAIRAGQLAGVSVGLGGVTIWLALLGLVTTPIMIHYLGPTRYGVFALIAIMSAYLANLEFGFGHATVRFLARARTNGDRPEMLAVVNTSFAVFLVSGLVAAAIAFAGSGWIGRTFFHGAVALRPEAIDAIRLGSAILFVTFLSSFAGAALQALARFRVVVASRAVFGTLASAGAVAAVLVGGHLRLVLIVQAAVAASLCLVLFVFLGRSLGWRMRPRVDRRMFRAMASFGAFVLIAGLAYQVMLQGPPTVLARFSSTAQVAAFAVPYLVLQNLAVLATATSIGFMPFASAASVDPEQSNLAAVYQSNLRLTFLVMGPLAAYLAVFAHPLLATWIDPRFASTAVAPMQFLALAAVMLSMGSAPADVARALGRPRWVAVFTLCAAAVAVGTAFAAASSDGAAGAAFALALGLTVTTPTFIALVAMRILGLRLNELAGALMRPIFAVGGLATVFGIASLFSPTFVMAVVAGCVSVLVYALSAFRFVLNKREQKALRRNCQQRLRRSRAPARMSPGEAGP